MQRAGSNGHERRLVEFSFSTGSSLMQLTLAATIQSTVSYMKVGESSGYAHFEFLMLDFVMGILPRKARHVVNHRSHSENVLRFLSLGIRAAMQDHEQPAGTCQSSCTAKRFFSTSQ